MLTSMSVKTQLCVCVYLLSLHDRSLWVDLWSRLLYLTAPHRAKYEMHRAQLFKFKKRNLYGIII